MNDYPSKSDVITVRRAETPADYRACQDAQRLAWGLTDDSYVVPIATMVGAQHHGGLVLGAFREDGVAVGMSFAFLGRIDRRECLYSQLTGVVPTYQSRGLGLLLKHAQRSDCKRRDIPILAWAFDPMQARNARFNLMKLGATCRRLVSDMYGPRTDSLNTGVPTDRLIAEWDVTAGPREELDVEEVSALPRVIGEGTTGGREMRVTGATRVLLEIPDDIASLRSKAPDDALAWQAVASRALCDSFDRGYRAERFARWEDETRRPRCGYVLAKLA